MPFACAHGQGFDENKAHPSCAAWIIQSRAEHAAMQTVGNSPENICQVICRDPLLPGASERCPVRVRLGGRGFSTCCRAGMVVEAVPSDCCGLPTAVR